MAPEKLGGGRERRHSAVRAEKTVTAKKKARHPGFGVTGVKFVKKC